MIGNRYELREQLGVGGMGIVYRATDRLVGRDVALKRVLVKSIDNEEITHTISRTTNARLAISTEFRTLATLHHPNIISVLDYGFDEDQLPYFTMSLLKNARSIRVVGAFHTHNTKINLLIQTLQALAYIHRRGVLHRDLKPSNILVTQDNQVKVLDFGIATVTNLTGIDTKPTMVGTFAYMAPELFLDKPASIASDLYSVGMVAYRIFAGKHPYDIEDSNQLIQSIVNEVPDYTELDSAIAPIIERLLSKNPQDRFDNAESVIQALCVATNRHIPKETKALRESFLQASHFVGREPELDNLRQAMQEAIDGHGQAWLIGGESGVGKSRLVEELRIHALVEGALVLHGQGIASGGLPYQQWREPVRLLLLTTPMNEQELSILKEIVPDIETLLHRDVPDIDTLTGTIGQQRLIDTIIALFERSVSSTTKNRTIVLILEDLHWADESLLPLRALINACKDLPILIIGTYRDDEYPQLPQYLPNIHLLKLDRLNTHQIMILSQSILGTIGTQRELIELITRETEGNAFFIVEVIRELAEIAGGLNKINVHAIPEYVFAGGIEQVINRRLSYVPDDAQVLLKFAAAIERQIDLKLIRVIKLALEKNLDVRNIALDEWLAICANVAVLEFQDGHWRFAHDKLRENLLRNLSDQERPEIYQQVANAVETLYGQDDSKAVALAEYWHIAGDYDKELFYTLLGVENAQRVNAFRETISLTKRAIALFNESADQHYAKEYIANLERQLGEAFGYIGDYEEARAHLQLSIALAESIDDKQSIALAHNVLGDIAQDQGEYESATHHHNISLALFREINDLRGVADALTDLGRTAQNRGDYQQARAHYEESLQISHKMDDKETLAEMLNYLGGTAEQQGAYEDSHRHYMESLRLWRELGEQAKIASVLDHLGRVAERRKQYEPAMQYYEESLIVYRQNGHILGEAFALGNLGGIAMNTKDYHRAQSHCEQSLAIFREAQNRLGEALTLNRLGHIALRQGDYPIATQQFQDALKICKSANVRGGIANCYGNLGLVSEHAGKYDFADNFYRQSLQICKEMQDRAMIATDLTSLAFVAMETNTDSQIIHDLLMQALRLAWRTASTPITLMILSGFAKYFLIQGELVKCTELINLIIKSREIDDYVKEYRVLPLLTEIKNRLTTKELTDTLHKSHTHKLDKIVQSLLKQSS